MNDEEERTYQARPQIRATIRPMGRKCLISFPFHHFHDARLSLDAKQEDFGLMGALGDEGGEGGAESAPPGASLSAIRESNKLERRAPMRRDYSLGLNKEDMM